MTGRVIGKSLRSIDLCGATSGLKWKATLSQWIPGLGDHVSYRECNKHPLPCMKRDTFRQLNSVLVEQ